MDQIHLTYTMDQIHLTYTMDQIHLTYTMDQIHLTYTEGQIHLSYTMDQIHLTYAEGQIHTIYTMDQIYLPYTMDQIHSTYSMDQIHLTYTEDQIYFCCNHESPQTCCVQRTVYALPMNCISLKFRCALSSSHEPRKLYTKHCMSDPVTYLSLRYRYNYASFLPIQVKWFYFRPPNIHCSSRPYRRCTFGSIPNFQTSWTDWPSKRDRPAAMMQQSGLPTSQEKRSPQFS